MKEPQPDPPATGWLSWLTAVKGLTITNAIVIGMLALIGVPLYLVYSAVQNTELLDRFFSNYREVSNQNVACAIREAKFRGGAPKWTISTGFAFVGRDSYIIAVALDYRPSDEEMQAYCETLKILADTIGREAIDEVRP